MKEMTYLGALIEAVREEMDRNERILLFGQGAVAGGPYNTAAGLYQRFGPVRVRDVPISENSVVGCAVGAALTGLRPIVEILYSDFLMNALDQLVNQAAKYRYISGGQISVPLVIRCAVGYGACRGAQHSQSFEAVLSHFPGLKVIVPSTPRDVKGLLKSAIRDNDPVVMFDHFQLFPFKGPVPEEEYTIPLGQADVKREGSDVTIVALSVMLHETLKAAEALAAEGIHAEVIDPRTLVPLDLDTILRSVRKTNHLLIVEGGVERHGVGAEIIASVVKEAFDYLDAPPVRLGIPNVPLPFARAMESYVLPNRTRIAHEVRQLLKKNSA
jgi:pyruvate/2-oxoglutarate/acetoin dehydrogenase E1 component